MKRMDHTRIIVSLLMILVGLALYYYLLPNPFKGYSIIFFTSGIAGLIGLLKNRILKIFLIALLLCITIIIIIIE